MCLIMAIRCIEDLLYSGFVIWLYFWTCKAETKIICDETPGLIVCDNGIINVTSGTYGRTDKFTCRRGSINNCKTLDVSDVVAERCTGRTKCTIFPHNNLFGDPCLRTRQIEYLNISYQCIDYKNNSMSTVMATQIQRETTQETNDPMNRNETPGITLIVVNVSEVSIGRGSSNEGSLGSVTGPIIGLGFGIVLILLVVLVSLRQRRKQRKYVYNKRAKSPIVLNKTYDTAIYRPKMSSVKHKAKSKQENNNSNNNPIYENTKDKSNSEISSLGESLDDKVDKKDCSLKLSLVHSSDLKPNQMKAKSKRQRHNYVRTVMMSNDKTSDVTRPFLPDDALGNTTCSFQSFKPSPHGKAESRKLRQKIKNETENNDYDSYYLDMSLKSGKTTDIDIKYMTMDRKAKLADDVSVNLYANDMNCRKYCNVNVHNKDNITGERKTDIIYENVNRNQQDAIEESVYEPYDAGSE